MKKNVIVTGAARGLGKEIARHAAAKGYNVLATVRKDSDVKIVEDLGCTAGLLDLHHESTIEEFARFARNWSGGNVFALINNAGTIYPAPFELLDSSTLQKQFQANVFGHVVLTQKLLPSLSAASGRVIMISSISAALVTPIFGAYSASKRALEAMTEALAMEVRPLGVDVCIIRPGPYVTSIWGKGKARGEAFGEDNPYAAMMRQVHQMALNQNIRPATHFLATIDKVLKAKKPGFLYTTPFSYRMQIAFRGLIPHRWFFKIIDGQLARARRKLIQESSTGELTDEIGS